MQDVRDDEGTERFVSGVGAGDGTTVAGQGTFDSVDGSTLREPTVPDAPSDAGPRSRRPRFAPGSQVVVRNEQWLVKKVADTTYDGWMVEVTGVSSLVRGMDAVFYEKLDHIEPIDPDKTRLVPDASPNHRKARLYLEAVIRKTALPQTEHGLALVGNFLMDQQTHQLRPAELALSRDNPQPRVLIADVVGLGKTLEIGILLAELIRRGRGERILVVTPAHVLEQFQRELWTRFSIPLVRLDSTGIQRIQQDIPAGRNPFAYFKRAIISVDTLKSDVYAHHLENTEWDAVVIDESHNLVNRNTKNNGLARLLARRSDAFVLASATPHNGDGESFAELIGMLDDAAIADSSSYDVKDLKHLYIRRTKTDREVRDSLKGEWADRGPSKPVFAEATEREEAVLAELAARWIPRDPAASSVCVDSMVAYNLLKAFLSSHRAFQVSVAARTKTLEKPLKGRKGQDPAQLEAARQIERKAIVDLARLADDLGDDDSSKLDALVKVLKDIGVGPGSDARVVVFSERIPTLKWLAETVPARLGFPRVKQSDQGEKESKPWKAYGGVVEVMHGDATGEQEQQRIVEEFGLATKPVRLLFTGDVASEGVNLHQQCHELIHYDLPWSLIRIEQRNGRIDRYGQKKNPRFRALVLTSDVEWRTDNATGEPLPLDDRLVGAKLLAREEEAHRIEGTAEAVTGIYKAKEEEDRLTRDLIAGRTVEESIEQSSSTSGGGAKAMLARAMGNVGAKKPTDDVPRATVPGLFGTVGSATATSDYFDEALRHVCHPISPDIALKLRREGDGTLAFQPPPDLLHRLKALPKSYLTEQEILPTANKEARIRLTFDKGLAGKRLKVAREESDSQWPNVSYVSDVHPVLDWVTDKALAALRHDEAFVLAFDPDLDKAADIDPELPAALDGPVYLLQGIYSNKAGRPTVVEWMAVAGLPDAPRTYRMDNAFLAACRVGPSMPGRAAPVNKDALQRWVPSAVAEARRFVEGREAEYAQQIEAVLAPFEKRVTEWKQAALFTAEARRSQKKKNDVNLTADRRRTLIRSLRTSGAPLLRLLAVLEPLAATPVPPTAGSAATDLPDAGEATAR
ncbi:SNF2 domain-containing protein [Streptomyces sp. Ag82_O1-15]|uniref:DEAD/DEAH box helicase n=1 Tax=Streptomyces sp. Ag82_O1-15 TaxID=1938855 RepID=UPI000BB0FE7E|nr:DEAD/DEAH box helicase [Streptomyces sp. Ag82_O1-15]PBC92431.1 SNF2 domain-containing protein [Streptomyces sp. Ag82_O1-15]